MSEKLCIGLAARIADLDTERHEIEALVGYDGARAPRAIGLYFRLRQIRAEMFRTDGLITALACEQTIARRPWLSEAATEAEL